MGRWTTFRSQLQHPVLDQDDQAFRSRFQTIHNRLSQQEDVPTWHHIILTENIITHRPLTWQEYQAAARQHMLRPLICTRKLGCHTGNRYTGLRIILTDSVHAIIIATTTSGTNGHH